MRSSLMILAMGAMLLSAAPQARSQTSAPATAPSTEPVALAPTTAPTTAPTVVIVVGAEGTAEYGKEFAAWADRWAAAAGKRCATIVQIGRIDGESPATTDKDRLKNFLEKQSKTDPQPLWIVLIGHGTYDGQEAKFNLRGPDFSDLELAAWLKPFTRPIAVLNCSAASAPFLKRLSGRNRVTITATRAGSEIQYARFGDYVSASMDDPAADLDKDGQVSLLEAFLAASHRTAEFYSTASRLASEHALLDDNGDGLGIGADWFEGLRATRSARDGAPLDGPRARQWVLVQSPSEQAMPPELRAQRDQLEMQVEALRSKKATMPEDEYYDQLEKFLIELAHIYERAPTTQPAGH